jgi:choice-of-anchor A domain-containing protein
LRRGESRAASFVAFSDGAFNSSQSSGTSITGRIAAASDVTLDGVTVNPAAGDSAPTVIAGGNFVAGNTGHGGTLNGGVRYAGTIDVAQNFTVNGAQTHAPPPFSFVSEFAALTESSHAWAKIAQTPGATVTLDPNSHALQLTGTDSGLNVFAVSAADLQAAAGIVIDLKQSGATALINVTAATQLSLAPQYMNLAGNASDRTLMWNLPSATGLAVTHGVAWKGVILAPTATITGVNHPQLNGQLIGRTIPTSDWVLNYVPFSGCLPPGLASPSLSSTASAPVRLGPGSSISDVAHLSDGVTPTGTITFKLHGPNDQDCTGSAVFSSTSTAAGNGYFGSGSFTPERTGTYRWVVDYSGDQNNRPAGPTACDDSNETVEVSRADTSLSSDVPHAVEPAGSEIHDTATLTGAVSPVGALTFKLYGPDDATCANAPIFNATIGFTGGG